MPTGMGLRSTSSNRAEVAPTRVSCPRSSFTKWATASIPTTAALLPRWDRANPTRTSTPSSLRMSRVSALTSFRASSAPVTVTPAPTARVFVTPTTPSTPIPRRRPSRRSSPAQAASTAQPAAAIPVPAATRATASPTSCPKWGGTWPQRIFPPKGTTRRRPG